jgi:hypothetical protein
VLINRNKLLRIVFALLIVTGTRFASAKILYVDDDAIGANDGSSWVNAYWCLQDALANAQTGDKIRVAQGIYRPDKDTGHPNGTGDRKATFELINGVTIKGGYAGFGEPDPNIQDLVNYKSVLSGDLNDDDSEVASLNALVYDPTRADNSYHVVMVSGMNETAILDGFTITSGNAGGYIWDDVPDEFRLERGGGIYNYESSPTLTNCTFSENSAIGGGGMFNGGNSYPILTDCAFSGNSATFGGGMNNQRSNPTLINCTFSGNSATFGGGMNNWESNPTIANCTFIENSVELSDGGGMNNWESSPTLTDCIFSGNAASLKGGGMNNWESNPILTNCTFSENSAIAGGGMFNDGNSYPTLTNCEFSGNSAKSGGGGMDNQHSSPTLINCAFSRNSASYSGGGMSNIVSDPILTNCNFSENSTWYRGGGMTNAWGSPTLTNCTFSRNSADNGGGMNNWNSSPTLTGSNFSGNSAKQMGGGMYNELFSNPTMTNCTFSGNSAEQMGGGMYNELISSPILTNCTFAQNSADNGSAFGCDSDEQSNTSNVELINCILWDGGNEIWKNDNSTILITYSNIQGGFTGKGNIEADPLFADLGYFDENGTPEDVNDDHWVDGDYHLKSEAGRFEPNTEAWIQDDVTSPCIDAGNPDSPVAFEPNPNGGIINMGAYGSTAEASKSPSGLHAKYGSGTEEPNNPYLIYNAEQLKTIGTKPEYWDKHFRLMTNLDLEGVSLNSIGYWGAQTGWRLFTDVFDGDGKSIANLVGGKEVKYTGLFVYMSDGC